MYEQRPWAANPGLMYGHIIGMEKHHGVWLLVVGETCRWIMAKCVLMVDGQEAKEACMV